MKEGIKKKLYGSEREHEIVKTENNFKRNKGKDNDKEAVRKRARKQKERGFNANRPIKEKKNTIWE